MSALDEYFESLDTPSREAFQHIRGTAMAIVPEAEQGTSYGMAALMLNRKPLLGFRAATGHLSIFPFSSHVVDAVRGRLATFDSSKGTIRFSAAMALPDDVVRDIVTLRRDEILKSGR